MRIFKNKIFHRWAQEIRISDDTLKKAIDEISKGLYEGNLGGNIFKKRVALEGRGKSAGTRTIVAFRTNIHAFFIYGFAKNDRANISKQEERALKQLAKLYFSFSEKQLDQAIKNGELSEVK